MEIVGIVPDPVNEIRGGDIHTAAEKICLKIRPAATISS